ncbi:MAG: GNAT family N-acetyltransferase [Xanthomonadales bacterium]|nr:GNAT family N-acetyltransferase [Xanthomonadales bacterium]
MVKPYMLRLATMRDAGAIARVSRDLIETGLGWSWTPARVQRAIERRETAVLVADHAASVVGFAVMEFGDEDAHLSLLGVRPDWQRAGLGRSMVTWLEDSARIAGTLVIRLEVRETNRAAQRFYGRLGYRRLARLAGYYRGRENAIRMGRNLAITERRSRG